ncbi:MAG TPA: nitrilase-related carbon-nitrogen hydrolase [Verrucomicrobiae bacterium]|nr:nitrilase-related carbon-nitrogen hydrolase [Verrucomicrobiae bacterium]
MNVVGVQMDIRWEDKSANLKAARALVQKASPLPRSLVVLPEMFATGFSMNTAGVAEEYGGPTEMFLAGLAKEFGVYVLAGAAMRSPEGKFRNKALYFSFNGKLEGYYAKMRPFTPGGESKHYAPGAKPAAFECEGTTLAPFVCYDLRFPELFRRITAQRRPEVFVVIASWPEKRITHWTRLLQARAIENQAYVIGVNRVGVDPFYTYSGQSVIVDFNGEIVAQAGAVEGCINAQLDLEALRHYRKGLPFLEDLQF